MSEHRRGGDAAGVATAGGVTPAVGRLLLMTLAGAVLATAAAGCRTEMAMGQAAAVSAKREVSQLFEVRVVVGESVEGRPIEVAMLGTGHQTVLILSTIHGDEAAGTQLCRVLIEYLRERPEILEGRRVVVMPVANPDGKAAGTRGNARGVDLNRNFPARNRVDSAAYGLRALSEPEARALHRLIDTQQPRRVVSVHQPLACVDYDGPAEALAARISDASGLPVRQLGARPGSLGSYVGLTLGVPIVTLELPREADRRNSAELWQAYGPALVEAIVFESP